MDLVIEGLSLLIEDAQKNGRIWGIKISSILALIDLLFVDDVVLFGTSTLAEWMAFDVIMDMFCFASGMYIGIVKSSFLFNEMDEGVLNRILHFLPYKVDLIHVGFKYLGYYIKPLSYGIND